MPSTIFYAWQSDRDQKCCRYLIRDAANVAIKKLASDAAVEDAPRVDMELDHDRKGIPGQPHLAETIKDKIANCKVFIADLNSVCTYRTSDGRDKAAQNANVLIELGLAMRFVPLEHTLFVMNTAFGSREHLPFDLKHLAFPIQYELADASDNAKVRAARKQLADEFTRNLKQMLPQKVKRPRVRFSEMQRTAYRDRRDYEDPAMG